MRSRVARKKFDIDSWLKVCIKRTFDFYREYSYSYVSDLIQQGQLFSLTSRNNQIVGKIEVIEINSGPDYFADSIIDEIIKTFNEKHGLENRRDLDTLIYEYGKNEFSCRLVCKLLFLDEEISQSLHKIELLIPISPNILSPSMTGCISVFKEFEKLGCILSLNSEFNTLAEKQLSSLKNISEDLSFLLMK